MNTSFVANKLNNMTSNNVITSFVWKKEFLEIIILSV